MKLILIININMNALDSRNIFLALLLGSATAMAQELGDDSLTVVTTASKTERVLNDTTASVQVIGADEINATGGSTVADVLATQGGIELEHSLGRTGAQLQGLDPKYVLILIDGRRVTGRVNGTADLGSIRLSDVERIEVIRGPQSALHGADALGGVINIVTRKAKTSEARASVTAGSHGRFDAETQGGIRTEDWGVRVSAGYGNHNGYSLSPESLWQEGQAVQSVKISQNSSINSGKNAAWATHTTYQIRDTARVDAMETGAIIDRKNRTEELSAGASSTLQLSPDSVLIVGADYGYMRDQFANDQRSSSALDQLEETLENLGEARVTFDTFIGSHRLVAGADMVYQTLASERLAGDGSRTRVAAFAQDEWYVSESPLIAIMPGLRTEYDSQYGLQVTPKISARWDIVPELIARTGIGMGYRAPDFRELLLSFDNRSVGYTIRGNPNLEPEESWGINAGLEWSPVSILTVSTSAYQNNVNNMIGFHTVSEMPLEFAYVNIAEAWTMGLESSLRLGNKQWSTQATMVFEDTEDRALGLPLEGRSIFRATLSGHLQLFSKTRLDGRLKFNGRRVFYAVQPEDDSTVVEHADPYVLGNVRVDQELWGGFSTHVGCDNIFNAGSPDRLTIEPRAFYAGVSGKW